MNADEVYDFFKQENISAIGKVQALKLAIVWRVYLGLPHDACYGGFENRNFSLLDEWLRSQKDIDRVSFHKESRWPFGTLECYAEDSSAARI